MLIPCQAFSTHLRCIDSYDLNKSPVQLVQMSPFYSWGKWCKRDSCSNFNQATQLVSCRDRLEISLVLKNTLSTRDNMGKHWVHSRSMKLLFLSPYIFQNHIKLFSDDLQFIKHTEMLHEVTCIIWKHLQYIKQHVHIDFITIRAHYWKETLSWNDGSHVGSWDILQQIHSSINNRLFS